MRERGAALAILDVDIGACFHQRLDHVDVVLVAVAQHDGFDQRGPAEIVDEVERRLGSSVCAAGY